jgi:hypothetical protein
VNLLPIYLLGASAWLVTQSIDWIMGQHEAPAVLFVGWMMLTLCFYIVAALIRHPVFVYTGAMSMMGMFLLMFQGVWDPLHLFVIGTGLIATCYAVGTLGLWKRYASATPAYEAALWSVWKPGSRQEGRALWGKSHRELGLWLALVSCFVNAFIWALSVYIRGGESILELRAVSPLFTLVSLLCCSLPFLWEARRKSRRSWIFHTGNVILGLAFTLGSLSLFEVNRESFLHATTWIKMTGIGALVLQVIYLLFAKVVAPRVKSTEHQHNVASAFLSSLNEAFRIYAFGAVVLFVLVATQQESIDTTLLLCLLAPLVLTQFSSADAFGLLAAGVVAAFGWSYGVLVPWWGIGILGLSGSLYLLALRSHWAASTGNKKHLGVPAWLMIAAAIAGSAAQLVPFGTSDTGIAASWCMGLGLAALITQVGLWVLRRISPSFDTSFGAGGILISKFKINGTPTVSMAFWHVLQFSFLVIALLGVAFSLVAMESLGTHMHWSVCLLPFAIALPLFFELAQQPHKFGIVLAVIATSLGVYFTFGQPWRGTDQQLMLPVYILLILWLAGLLVTKQLTKTKQSANSGEEQSESDESLPTNKHQALFVFSRQLFWLLTAPTLGIGCVIWLFALWETVFGVALLTHAASYERFLFAGIWGTIGVPLVYVWAHQQFRKGWSLFVLMLVLVAWPPALVGWLHYGLGLPRLTPAIGWAALVLFSGVFVYRIGQTTKSTWNGSVHPELRQLSVWTSIFGILSFLTLLATTSSRLWGVGAVQWLCIAGLVTIGWMLVAIRRMDSVKWMLQGTLALVWTIHGLIILTLPSYYGSFKYPALFALLLMLAVIVCYRLAHAAKQGRFAKWTEPLWHDAPDQEEALARLNERIAKNFVHVNFLISVCASLLVGYAWVGSATHLISIERFLIIPVLGLLAWSWVAQALSSKRDLWAYFGVFSALALYGYLRSAFGIGTRHMDAWVLLIIGFASTGLRMIWQKLGGELLQRVMFRTSFALPVLVWILNTTMGTPMPPGIWIMSGLYYGVVAYQYEKKWLFVPALLFGNIEVFSVLSSIAHADPFKQPQWYALSFGASLFAFIGIYHKDLAPKTRTTLRNIGTFVIYLSSMYQVLFLNNIFDIIVLAVLAIAGVFAGIMFHIRSYLYLGALFLVLNIVVNLFRIGIQDRVIGMVFLFVTGLLLLVSAVYFNLKRDELLKTYTEWREKVSEWEG